MTEFDASSAPTESTLAFPASVAQQAFWYLELLDKNVTAFNVPLRFRIDGPLDIQVLERSLEAIASRHESLRTHFEEDGGELLQIVRPHLTVRLDPHDISHLPADLIDEEADRLGSIEAKRTFKLSSGPLFRTELIKVGANVHHLHVTVHHALFDGMSIAVLIDELAEIYEAKLHDRPDSLVPLPIQYGDFSVWQKEFLETPEIQNQLAWWKTNLAGMVELDLPTDHPRPSKKSWKGDIVSAPLPKNLTDRLQAISNRNSSTLFHLQLAAFKILLQRYTGSTDISVGTPVSGRTRAEIEPLIGVFINSLILRNDLSGNPSFETLLGRVRDNALQAISHQDLPFENLVRELKPERDSSRNPLFQINFSHDRFSPKPHEFGGIMLAPISSRSPGSIFDLHLFMTEREGVWRACCDFSTDLFDRSSAVRMLGHFRKLLEQIADDPARPIDEFEILTDSERDQILHSWSGETRDYPRDATIAEIFTDIAKGHTESVALIHGDVRISYRQLHADAATVAARLVAAGTKAGELVAISAKPSPDLIAGILGIVLAGAVYVPLNPSDPIERTKLLLDECGAKFCVVDSAVKFDFNGSVIELPKVGSSTHLADLPPLKIAGGDPAYLMFTSGSTGKPKGVLVPHRAVLRLVKNPNFLPIRPDDVFLHAAPASFDASTLEIWGPLLNGARLVIPENGNGLDRIAAAIEHYGITTLWLTAGLFNLMIEEHAPALSKLRYLLAGGDVLSVRHVQKALASLPKTALINGYGPTENTTFTTTHRVCAKDLEKASIPIGKPVSNSSVFILDSQGRPTPIGIPGELHTGGDGLAIGYHRDEKLTAEKFLVHPQFGRLYRTGDLCRWNADGSVEFIGRWDHQVKVRGFRIEPSEIEAALISDPEVRDAKVAVRGDDSETKRVLAWVIPAEGMSPSAKEISKRLSKKLPAFMCPDAIGIVEQFPITANGKIDTAALQDPRISPTEKIRLAPVGDTEIKLAELWCELLGIEEIGRDEAFFSLGGHSLMALRMFSRINRDFDRSLPLSALITHPTIRELSLLLEPETSPPEAMTQPNGKGHLVSLSAGGADVPLFCIHGGDGGVLFYRDLAALMPESLPIFAIESTELSSSDPIEKTSVEETAESYVQTLLAEYPQGPFRLAGYSYGGVVAHEMACNLTEKGHHVEFLGLLDTHNPAAPSRPYSSTERVGIFWKQNEQLPLASRSAKLLKRFAEGVETNRRVKREVAAANTQGAAKAHGDLRRVQVRQENWRAMQAYQPRPFLGKIVLFKASEQSDKIEWPDDYGWSTVAKGGFEIVSVPGKHLTIFEGSNVTNLAAALRPALESKPQ